MKSFLPKYLYTSLLLAFSLSSYALETDNYLMWNRELKDSGSTLNKFFKSHILKVLKKSHKQSHDFNCLDITQAIAKDLRSKGVRHNPVENHMVANLKSDSVYPKDFSYVKRSIYRDPFLFYLPSFGLSPNIQINNYYFGTDKLSHFASTGYLYFLIYHYYLSQNFSKIEAQQKAILYGMTDEKTMHGYLASGVFSYADLEANYKGLLFYQRLCSDSKKTYLKKDRNGFWQLQIDPDIADYVNGNWDESFLNSYFILNNWSKVSEVIRSEYCPMYFNKSVVERRNYYQKTSEPSFSMNYIKSVFTKNQSIASFCLGN